MDYNTLRGIFTVLIFIIFVVIVLWAFNKKRKQSFDNIASSILDDDAQPNTTKTGDKE